jgi:hypothetical protein
MSGALLLAAAAGGLACWAGLAAAALRIDSPVRFCLAAYVLAWAGLVAVTVVLSIPGWLNRWSLAASIAALVAVGLAVWLRRGRPRPARLDPEWREFLRDPVVGALGVAVLLAGLYLCALAVLTTPNDWDGLTYHETRALLWDEQGGIGYVPSGNDPRLDGNPPVSEIGLYLALMLPRSERFAALPQYLALWASLLAVVLLARRLGLSRPAAAYGGLVFATLPIVFLQGASIQNDLVVASFLLAAVVFLLRRGTPELIVGSLALGLALSTKFNAVLALPLLVGVVLAGVPKARRGASALACGAGVLLGSPWYVVNLVRTGSLDGELGDTTGQATDHSFRTIVGALRALTFDVVDTSGLWRSEMYVAVAAGFALIAFGAILRTQGGGRARVLLYAGCLAAMTPLALRSLARPTRYLWEHFWFRIGREDIATDHGDAWTVLSVPDTSLSWYGAAGAVVIAGGVVLVIVGIRRRELQPVALLFALAPWILVATFALTIIYDAWRGRLLIFGVGLACAAWGWTLRVRWLSGGIAALCITTLSLSLVHSFTKPSGLRLLEPPISRSVWGRDRIDTLTVIRNFDGTPALLREIESKVPRNAEIAVATPIDTFVAPLAGPHLSRTLHLVADGDRVPPEVTWIVLRGTAEALGCRKSWTTVFTEDEYDWRLLRRTGPDACGEDAATL